MLFEVVAAVVHFCSAARGVVDSSACTQKVVVLWLLPACDCHLLIYLPSLRH